MTETGAVDLSEAQSAFLDQLREVWRDAEGDPTDAWLLFVNAGFTIEDAKILCDRGLIVTCKQMGMPAARLSAPQTPATEILARVRDIREWSGLGHFLIRADADWLCAQVERDQAELARLRKEGDWLRRLLDWCHKRLRKDGYVARLDVYIAEGPTDPDETRVVLSATPSPQQKTSVGCPITGGDHECHDPLCTELYCRRWCYEPPETPVEEFVRLAYEETGGPTPALRRCYEAYMENERRQESIASESAMERAQAIVDQFPVPEEFDAKTCLIEEVATAITEAEQAARAAGRAEAFEEAAVTVGNMPIQIYRDEGIGPAGRSCKTATFDDAVNAIRALATPSPQQAPSPGAAKEADDIIHAALCEHQDDPGDENHIYEVLGRHLAAALEAARAPLEAKIAALEADYRDTVECLNYERKRFPELLEAAKLEGRQEAFAEALKKINAKRSGYVSCDETFSRGYDVGLDAAIRALATPPSQTNSEG